jgi:hypothetical protein
MNTMSRYERADIAALIDWLTNIDWSPSKAHDLSNMGLTEVGQITVTMKDGECRHSARQVAASS